MQTVNDSIRWSTLTEDGASGDRIESLMLPNKIVNPFSFSISSFMAS